MQQDLLSGNFIDQVNKQIIKRSLGLARATLVVTVIYTLLCLIDWGFALSDVQTGLVSSAYFFYYFIDPSLALVSLVVSLIACSDLIKANKLIDLAFEQQDAGSFNAGYSFFIRVNILTIISYILGIISLAGRIIYILK
jgi:hypothetical protein